MGYMKRNVNFPCQLGDRFFIIAYRERKVTEVECTGFFVNMDIYNSIDEKWVWVNSVEKPNDFWKVHFDEFEKNCFKSEEEAKLALIR